MNCLRLRLFAAEPHEQGQEPLSGSDILYQNIT